MDKTPNLKTPVMVFWKDAVSLDSWEAVDTPLLPAQCVSVGFLIAIDEDRVQLCLNHDLENDNASCVMTIPFGMVERILELKPRGKYERATIRRLSNRKKPNRV